MEEKIKLRLQTHKDNKRDILNRVNNPKIRYNADFIIDQANKLKEVCTRIDELESLGWM